MKPDILMDIGLSKSQATTYLRLVEKGELTPPQIANLTGESRSNTYMILQRLEELGLVEKILSGKKTAFQPLNPIALEQLAAERKAQTVRTEQNIKHAMPQLLSYFYSFTEKPGIRLLQGVEGLKEIYADTLRTREDIYFVRTPSDTEYLGEEYFKRYKKKRAQLGIATHAFTIDVPQSRKNSDDDELYLMTRTWLPTTDYSAPVEINIYGEKVAYLVFGEDIMGVIIQNRAIAESMKQLLKMISKGLS